MIGNFISCTVHRILFSLVKMMDAGVEFEMRQRQLAANIAGNWAKIIIQGNTIHLVAEKIEDASALTSGTWSDLEEVVAGRMRALHIAPVAAEGEDPRVEVQVDDEDDPLEPVLYVYELQVRSTCDPCPLL